MSGTSSFRVAWSKNHKVMLKALTAVHIYVDLAAHDGQLVFCSIVRTDGIYTKQVELDWSGNGW